MKYSAYLFSEKMHNNAHHQTESSIFMPVAGSVYCVQI
jgi:hypothetical protein